MSELTPEEMRENARMWAEDAENLDFHMRDHWYIAAEICERQETIIARLDAIIERLPAQPEEKDNGND